MWLTMSSGRLADITGPNNFMVIHVLSHNSDLMINGLNTCILFHCTERLTVVIKSKGFSQNMYI